MIDIEQLFDKCTFTYSKDKLHFNTSSLSKEEQKELWDIYWEQQTK